MPYTKDDVGDIPGRPPLSDKAKAKIAEEWNANAPGLPKEVVSTDEELAALRKAVLSGDKSDLEAIDTKRKA